MLTTMFSLCFFFAAIAVVCLWMLRKYIQQRNKSILPNLRMPTGGNEIPFVVGFFHPYCNAGGGGERVLWMAISALQTRYSNVRCVIYTGDTDATRQDILARVKQRFNIKLPRTGDNDIHFIFLYRRQWVEASPYPFLTLLGQSMGSLVLGIEALLKFIPDVYLDSMGYSFTLPLFKYIGGCKVGCYVHYPTISTDMLQRVSSQQVTYNNSSLISRSPFLSRMKLIYYKIFAYSYGVAGKCSDFIMVNSTWTHGHISTLWGTPEKTNIVYPPCDVQEFLKIPLNKETREQKNIVSIAQFRPEKDHALQIKSFAKFMGCVAEQATNSYKLILIGGCRNAQDEARVQDLRTLCSQLDVQKNVEFKLNVSFDELKQCLADSIIGLHTMWNEHFGIGVVECMAGGVVMLAHDSGGPRMDIVKNYKGQATGFLASSEETYADAMKEIFGMSDAKRLDLITSARESVTRFSNDEFETGLLATLEPILQGYSA